MDASLGGVTKWRRCPSFVVHNMVHTSVCGKGTRLPATGGAAARRQATTSRGWTKPPASMEVTAGYLAYVNCGVV